MRAFVSSYSIRVREKRTKESLPLEFEAGSSLHMTVYQTMSKLGRTPDRDQKGQRLLRIRRFRSDSTDIWGLLDRGEFGISARGVHNRTFKGKYYRGPEDAELLPLYFRFHLPADSNVGILILQRLGVHGAFGHLRRVLQEGFRSRHGNHILKIGRFVPSKVLRDLSRGQVRQMSLYTHSMPPDIAERMRLGGTRVDVGVIEIRVRARRKGMLWDYAPDWVSSLNAKRATIGEVFGEDYDRVSLRVNYRGQEAHVRLFPPGKLGSIHRCYR